VFMRYIERVLPSLGETAVALRALGEVVDGLRTTRHDRPAVADVKGSAAMAELLRRTARQAVPGAPREFRLFYRDDTLHLGTRDLGRLRRTLLSQGPRNRQVPRVASTLIDALWRQVGGQRALERGREEFTDTLLTDDRFLHFVRDWWPPLDAVAVLGWLRDREFLARVGEGVLEPAAQDVLASGWGDDLSIEDVPLVDELRYLLGDVPDGAGSFEPEPDPLAHLVDANMPELTTVTDRQFSGSGSQPRATTRIEDDTFAHVLVDEAQDLTPMQWRMVGRRGPAATWTVVGDPVQSSWPFPAEARGAREQALGDKPRHRFRLATNYRNSSEIYRFAAQYAERVGLAVDLPQAVRSTGVVPVELTADDLAAAVTRQAAGLLTEVPGTVGVVVPVARLDEVSGWLRSLAASDPEVAAALSGGDPRSASSRLVVLTGIETKGLEFDGILVVAPEEIESESVTGRSTTYVVLTRATQRLVTVGSPA
jgi:UvrD/REP helicase N-terminal domain